MDSQVQDAKLVERFSLECALSSARTKQSFCALSHNSTDALHFFPRLWQIMKRHSDEVGETANKPAPQCLGSRDSVPLAALIFVSNVPHSKERSRGLLLSVPPSQRIENGGGGSVADSTGRQQILCVAILQRFERQQIQYAVRHNDESFSRRCLRNRLHKERIQLLRFFSSGFLCTDFINIPLDHLLDFLAANRKHSQVCGRARNGNAEGVRLGEYVLQQSFG